MEIYEQKQSEREGDIKRERERDRKTEERKSERQK